MFLLLFRGGIVSLVMFISVRLEDARQLCARSRSSDEHNLLVELIDNYSDFLEAFITENEQSFQQLESFKSQRLEIIKSGPRDSPYYYFCQAEILLQWALVRSKHRQYIRAGWDINRAYKLLKKCKKEYPDFILVDKSLSVIHALIGSISGIQKGVIKLFTALDGSVMQGIEEINHIYESVSPDNLWAPEVSVVRSLMSLHVERTPQQAYDILLELSPEHQHQAVIQYLMGSNLQKLGRSIEAQEFLCGNFGEGQLPFYYMDLQCGISRLNTLDTTAFISLQRYVDHFEGGNYIAEGYQKLGWFQLLINKDTSAYYHALTMCLSRGDDQLGEDQQAMQEARANKVPHVDLLRSRLLFDGGQYQAAKEALDLIKADNLNATDLLEYTYRQGRVAQRLEDAKAAIYWYGRCINLGRSRPEYYACNAALQIAELYRYDKDAERSKYYYKLCLDINPETYKSSLHQKAQLGLDAIAEL